MSAGVRGSESALRVAIVADYLNQRGGAEWVVAVLHEMFPGAPIFTTIVDTERLWASLQGADIRPSWMQKLPALKRHFKKYLPLYYLAVEHMNLSEFDVVISSSCAFGLGTKVRDGAAHVCYCHTPARFIWNYDRYVEKEHLGPLTRRFLPLLIRPLKRWDLIMSRRPDHFVANSSAVAGRIRSYYGRDAVVIHPPVNTKRFFLKGRGGDYFLIVSRLNSYKRIELAVEAFNILGLPLVIVGEGPHRDRLQQVARSNVRFTGWLSDREVAETYAGCRALVFPGEEDFGIAILEANASGRPVIAYRGGGALDTVVEGETGVLFSEPTPIALIDAVERVQAGSWSPPAIRAYAQAFGVERFKARLGRFVEDSVRARVGTGRVLCA